MIDAEVSQVWLTYAALGAAFLFLYILVRMP